MDAVEHLAEEFDGFVARSVVISHIDVHRSRLGRREYARRNFGITDLEHNSVMQ